MCVGSFPLSQILFIAFLLLGTPLDLGTTGKDELGKPGTLRH